jgi:hypothetical protein
MAEQQLKHRLYRWECPTSQALVDYHLGLLSAGREAVGAHVADCVRCQAELAELGTFLGGEPLPRTQPSPNPPARRSLREILGQFLPQTPALALRGEGAGPLVAQAGQAMVMLDPQPVGERAYRVIGQLADPDQDVWTGALAQLRRAGETTHTAILDDMGGFQFEAVEAGRYELRFTPREGTAIVLPEVNLGGAAAGP